MMPNRPIPADVDAERGLVGSIIRDPSTLDDARIFVSSPAMFTDETAGAVFAAMGRLQDARKPINLVSLAADLSIAGFPAFGAVPIKTILEELTATVPTAAHALYYAATVKEKAMLRDTISLCSSVALRAFDGGIAADVVDALQQGAAKIAEAGIVSAGRLAGDCLSAVLDDIHGNDKDLAGIRTGFPELDQRIGGLKPKHLICIGGAGKIGKTSFAMNIVGHVGLALRHPVAVISHEMTAPELTERLLISTVGIPLEHLRAGKLSAVERRRYEEVQQAIRDCRIVLDDAVPATIQGTRVRLRLFQRLYKIKLAIIDYYQLMQGADLRARRYDQLVEVSRGLKQLANDLNMPIVVLAQLNAEGQDASRPPRVTDIEECKRIFKDSNVVILLDREYERRKHDPAWLRSCPDMAAGTIDVAAIRAGEAGTIPAKYEGATQRWKTESQVSDDRLDAAYDLTGTDQASLELDKG